MSWQVVIMFGTAFVCCTVIICWALWLYARNDGLEIAAGQPCAEEQP